MKLFRFPNGLQVWNTPDAGSDTEFLYREIFERHGYEKHGITVSDGDVVFDVGANIGLFALSLMQRFLNLRILSFEPVPCTYACLQKNLGESPERTKHDVTPLNFGLGTTETKTHYRVFPRRAKQFDPLFKREASRFCESA